MFLCSLRHAASFLLLLAPRQVVGVHFLPVPDTGVVRGHGGSVCAARMPKLGSGGGP